MKESLDDRVLFCGWAALTCNSTIANQLFETNQPIASLLLPVASGGTGTITYQLTEDDAKECIYTGKLLRL